MRIVRLQVEGFKRLVAVDITPEGDLVEIRGNNAEGKSSVLDAIFAALGGAAAAPVKPVRTGEEYAIIRLDLGELRVTRFFSEDGTDRLKVENAEGAVFTSAQTMLDGLVGKIAFDPLAFARMDDGAQASELRRLVPLAVDLDELAKLDAADYAARRDVNRDGKALKARIEGIVIPSGDLGPKPDREALTTALANAAETNGAIERDRVARENEAQFIGMREQDAAGERAEAIRLREKARLCDEEAEVIEAEVIRRRGVLDGMAPLAEPVDTAKLRDDLQRADSLAEIYRRRDERDKLSAEFDALKLKSEEYTKAMADREAARAKALSEAAMPVSGLSFGKINEGTPDEALVVTFNGEPFSQASGAEQLRVSAALAMAANPKLRIMIVKDGSLLDKNGVELLRGIATEHDFQIWMEAVGDDGVGIIMEGGKVRGAEDPEPIPAPKRRKAKGEADEGPRDVNAPKPSETPDNPSQDGPTLRERRKPAALKEFTTPTPGSMPAPKSSLFDD